MKIRRLLIIAAAAAALLTSAACSSVNTDPGQVALHYSGGEYSSQKYQKCIGTSTRKNNQGVDENFYYYPAGQRTFKFSTDAGSDSGPLTASTKNQQELVVKGTITFTLNTSCDKFKDSAGKTWPGGKLQKFHETIGAKKWAGGHAYSTGGAPGDGWDAMIGVYIKDVADRAIDNEALKYSWAELYNDSAKKSQWERDVIDAIPGLVKEQAGEDFFKINNIVLQKPDISGALKAQLTEKEAAILRGQAAGVDKDTAKNWPGGIQAYLDYQRNLAVNKAIESGQVKVIPVPQGAAINIPAS